MYFNTFTSKEREMVVTMLIDGVQQHLDQLLREDACQMRKCPVIYVAGKISRRKYCQSRLEKSDR